MRLKNIKLAGFKSFVDPTTVPFNQNLIAVVGPNGCGKSNIVDAIRWVMGESSAKTLRGESMSDVIFNGSSTRKPVGQASVQLTFDNSDGSIGGEYAEYSEIAIKRVASRDGTSNYYLNNTKCRRKDITNVFLGTGLGPRSYSVIEQGMISRFIEAKPEELRAYLEEAAGISKYKERRRETESRIRHTRDNLERVEDLASEIGKQLEKLNRQAKAAEKYKILKKDERLNKAQLHALHWQRLDHELATFDATIKEFEVKIEEAMAQKRHVGVEIEHLRESQIDANDELNDIQGQYYGLGSEIAKIEQSINHHKERFAQLAEDKQRVQESVNELQQNSKDDLQQLNDHVQELVQIEPKFESAKHRSSGSHQALTDAEHKLQEWQKEWDEFSQKSSDILRAVELEEANSTHLQRRIQELTTRKDQLSEEKEGNDFSDLESTISSLKKTKDEQEAICTEQENSIDKVSTQINQMKPTLETLTHSWHDSKEDLQQKIGRYASLTALQQAALGENDDNTVKWLDKNGLSDKLRLVQQLEVEPGWEKAIEVVLGAHLEAICVDEIKTVEAFLSDIPDGTFGFCFSKKQSSGNVRNEKTLSSKVKGDNPVAELLNTIYCVDDLVAAQKLQSELQATESIVTKDGIWLSQTWMRIAKEKDQKQGVLQREKNIASLKESISQLEASISEQYEKIETAKQELIDADTNKEALQNTLNHSKQRLSDVRAEYSMKEQQLQDGLQRNNKLVTEFEKVTLMLEEQKKAIENSQNQLQQAQEKSETISNTRQQLEVDGQQCRESYEQLRGQSTEDAKITHQLEVRVETLKPQIATLKSSVERAEKQLQAMFERSAALVKSLEQGNNPVTDLQSKLEKVLLERVNIEASLKASRQKVEAVGEKLRDCEEEKESISSKVETIRRALEEKRLETRTIDVRKKTFEEQVVELGFQLKLIFEELPDNAEIQLWQEEAEKITARISRLGAINLAAIDEFKLQEERKTYLDSQYNDLIEALTTLENAIKKIDKETRSRFKETFDKVNDEFKRLFPKVFGGGSAHLELTGDDLLDTGITVIARPPGKRNTTIHLLSGGEKALTAVSLVFAIFYLNPAPFCLLDEVDAPLDDANVERFCTLVKEMSEKVQFLFISHNKLAIEMAEQLTGVTMQEPGVSRIVAVDVEEAVELAAA